MDRFSTVTDLKPLVCRVTKLAKIAQLVEHNLAKVGVAGSSPVFRSNILKSRFDRHFVRVVELVDTLL